MNILRMPTIALFALSLCIGVSSCSKDDNSETQSTSIIASEKTNIEKDTAGVAIDLGLSVKWADHNVGTNKPEGYGGLYGWADSSGIKSTTNLPDYPSAVPPTSIEGTALDIAHLKWGGAWRTPTAQEIKELCANCDIALDTVNSVKGLRFISRKNGNSVFFPCTGYRSWNMVYDRNAYGYYWSATLSSENSDLAYSLFVVANKKTGYVEIYSSFQRRFERFYGLAIRPVTP